MDFGADVDQQIGEESGTARQALTQMLMQRIAGRLGCRRRTEQRDIIAEVERDPASAPERSGAQRLELALEALAEHVRGGRGAIRKLGLERVDGEPAISSSLGPKLRAHGFQEGPRRLTLSA